MHFHELIPFINLVLILALFLVIVRHNKNHH